MPDRRRLLVFALAAACPALVLAQAPESPQPMRSGETITVERILVDARVIKANGDPITGLEAKDFRVRIDGIPAKVASVSWVPETEGERQLATIDKEEAATSLETPAPAGRLLIFFFQTDFAREKLRVTGQMKILSYADQLVDSLEPEDRVAVFSFDSHLKFRLDFSDRKEWVKKAMRDALSLDEPQRPQIVPSPSLSRHLDDASLRSAATSEQALFLLGNALRPIPGPKSLILFGWGLGRFSSTGVHMDGYYAVAQRALEQSRTSVFSLDITQADYHSLAAGLDRAAADTGGFYASTYNFPQLAISKLERTLAGHYELEVVRPDTKVVGVHRIDVDVDRRGAEVMARRSFIDKS